MKTFAEAEANLAESLPGYESRPQQQALARGIEESLAKGTPLLAQAGCGTGKSLGAMIPAILNGRRTIVSTATIALQEQYAGKDLPFLEANLGHPFTWALLKGRSNYVCRAKVNECKSSDLPQINDLRDEIDLPGCDGDVEHLSTQIERRDRQHVTITSAECPGKRKCPFGDVCFAEKAKEKARNSKIVITNHAMLMTELKVRDMSDGMASMLESFDSVILDEAHEIEEIATNQLRDELRMGGIAKFATEATNFYREFGPGTKDASNITSDFLGAAQDMFLTVRPGSMTMTWIVNHADVFINFVKYAVTLAKEIDACDIPDDRRVIFQKRRLVTRANNYSYKVRAILEKDEDELVRFCEEEEKGNVIVTVPLHIGQWLKGHLWHGIVGDAHREPITTILMSATLAVGGKFGFIQERLSLEGCDTLDVGTPFDYEKQMMLYVPPKNTPDPTPATRNAWKTSVAFQTMELINASKGGALLLFTSREAMQSARETIGEQIERSGYSVFMQGDAPNKVLAQQFKDDEHSVLFGLKSFFTGVDFAGNACRLVVIDKTPFPNPSDPVFKARSEQLDKKAGRSVSFMEMSVPMMTLVLLQAVGRLIRTRDDRGVVAILDSRLSAKPWGRGIVRSLPASPTTMDLKDVEAFYA